MKSTVILIIIGFLMISCHGVQQNNSKKEIEDSWTVMEGENNGNPMIIRRNDWCNGMQGSKKLPYRGGIALKFHAPMPNGFPTNDEMETLNELEDEIFKVIEIEGQGVVCLIITTSGFREYVMYLEKDTFFNEAFDKIQDSFKTYELTDYVERDENWALYEHYKK